MTDSRWHYPSELVVALAAFGLAPTARTPPALVRDALNDLYRFELRRLRERYLKKQVAKADYLAHVVTLRKQYWPLTLPLSGWHAVIPTSPAPTEDRS